MASQDALNVTPPGEMVDVGGFRLHAIARGQWPAPSVILEPALGGFALQYRYIQEGVAAFARVVAYDRAGQGWSETSPNPRTPANMAAELTTLLDRLGLEPPYVLVGHSFGGLLARTYAGFHPEQVAGVVLIDSSHPDQNKIFPNIDKMVGQMAMMIGVQKFLARLGLGKALTKLSFGRAGKAFSKDDLDMLLTIASQPKHLDTTLAEYRQHRHYFGDQSEVPASLGDLPLMVVTAGSSLKDQGHLPGMTAEQTSAWHLGMQKSLVGLSTRGEQVIVEGATHLGILMQPAYSAQVVEAIRHVVETVRSAERSGASIA